MRAAASIGNARRTDACRRTGPAVCDLPASEFRFSKQRQATLPQILVHETELRQIWLLLQFFTKLTDSVSDGDGYSH
jgi:hypothetical protein